VVLSFHVRTSHYRRSLWFAIFEIEIEHSAFNRLELNGLFIRARLLKLDNRKRIKWNLETYQHDDQRQTTIKRQEYLKTCHRHTFERYVNFVIIDFNVYCLVLLAFFYTTFSLLKISRRTKYQTVLQIPPGISFRLKNMDYYAV
jgi:hypothetical protein